MRANQTTSSFFNQISVPETFLSSIMPRLAGDSVKLYMYLLYLSDKDISFTQRDLMSSLSFTQDQLSGCLLELETADLIVKSGDAITINNISEMRLHSLYRPMEAVSPDQVSNNPARMAAIDTINKLHFKGFMSTSWYTTIDQWFTLYDFDPEVMVMLFNQCSKYNKLTSTNYAAKIAESWHANRIHTISDLEEYENRYSAQRLLGDKIASTLKLGRQLTDFESALVAKWHTTYGYDYSVIEIALSRSLRSTRLSFDYFDNILTEWFNAGLKTPEQIKEYEAKTKHPVLSRSGRKSPGGNFSDRDSGVKESDQDVIKSLIRKDKQS